MLSSHILNMTCGGYAKTVTRILHGVDPQARVEIDPPRREVRVESILGKHTLLKASSKAGYPEGCWVHGYDAGVGSDNSISPSTGNRRMVFVEVRVRMPSMALGYYGKNSLESVNQYLSRLRSDSYVNGKRR